MDKHSRFGGSGDDHLDPGGETADTAETDPVSATSDDPLDRYTPPDVDPAADIPYLFRRRTVGAERRQLQVELQSQTEQALYDIERACRARFDDEQIFGTDVREAAIIAGLESPERVVAIMEAWGYGQR